MQNTIEILNEILVMLWVIVKITGAICLIAFLAEISSSFIEGFLSVFKNKDSRRKVKRVNFIFNKDAVDCFCPTCGELIMTHRVNFGEGNDTYKYCYSCGQHLDWD